MFGKNPIRSQSADPFALAVEDIFYTLQGEGPLSGIPALFIRLAGCNLACHFCDTQFEVHADSPLNLAHVVDRITTGFMTSQRRLVVLTGGEPLRQNPAQLMRMLFANGVEHIQIETAGTVWPADMHEIMEDYGGQVTLVCSPKTPKIHPMIEAHCRHWKYIIRGGEVDVMDGLPNRGTQVGNAGKIQLLARPPHRRGAAHWHSGGLNPIADTVWLSPCDSYDAELNKVNVALARDLCLKFGYRLSLQVHKLVGVA